MTSTLTFLRRAAVFAALALGADALAAPVAPVAPPWREARQMVLVTIDGWNADQGVLHRFVRRRGRWDAVGTPWPVVIGKAGAAWGLGLQPPRDDGPVKREGDNRSPAGVFRIGTAFGYGKTLATAMPYRALSATDWCMDVSGARYYNRIVDAKQVGAAAVNGSSEPMRRDLHVHGDQRYRMGFVIDSNPDARPGAGSCIFGHLWASPTTGTAGCTAMTPASMRTLLGWLEPRQHPVFVLLPKRAYAALRRDWQLPALEGGR